MGKEQIERIRSKIAAKEPIYGTTVTLQEPIICEMAGVLGYDFVWIDNEHSVLERSEIRNHIISAKAGDTASFVRVVWNEPYFLKPLLEMGPDGVIVPFIRTVEEAKYAVSAFLYPPRGVRGFGPQRVYNYSTQTIPEYMATFERNIMKILQVECAEMLEHLDEVCKIEGVDMLFVGCSDLSSSLGILGQYDHPDFIYAREKICDVCNKNNMPFGVAGAGINAQIAWLERGALFFNLGSDGGSMESGMRDTLKSAKRNLGK